MITCFDIATSLGKFEDLTDPDAVRVGDSVQFHQRFGGSSKATSDSGKGVTLFDGVGLG